MCEDLQASPTQPADPSLKGIEKAKKRRTYIIIE